MFTSRSRPAPTSTEPAEPLFPAAPATRESPDRDAAAAPPEDAGPHPGGERGAGGAAPTAGEPRDDAPPDGAPPDDAPPTASGGRFDDALFDAPRPTDRGASERQSADGDEAPRRDVGDTHADAPPSPNGDDTSVGGEVVVSDIPPAEHPTSDDIAALTSELTRLAAEADERPWDEPQPWVGHTDDLDRPPPPPAAVPHVPVTEHPPAAVHDAHDGSRVTVTGTSDEGHLVVRVDPPAPGAAPPDPAALPDDDAGAERPTPEHRDEPSPTGVHAAAHERGAEGPRTRVHDERLDNRPGPIRLSPSEAVALAEQGPDALRRERPRSSA